MQARTIIISVSWVLAFLVMCSKEPSVTLDVDFSTKEQWKYNARILINGSVSANDTSTGYSGMAQCILLGNSHADKPQRLDITIPSVRLTADFMDNAEKENLKKQIEQLRLEVNLDEGTTSMPDTSNLPTLINGGWGLDKNLAKVLPVLPDAEVSPGFKWERNKQASIATSHGDAVTHLFQAFIVDSIYRSRGDTKASISWDLSYKVEPIQADTAGLLDQLPRGGEGKGHAIINTSENIIEHARIEFEVSSDNNAEVKIGWKELVELSVAG
ncbi:MAG: hypothetical protein GF350_10725 [Chitinivibrionales bacterium]|nr:hypothetical protein [Chitinivibrionales bacterium]